jgi:hypothetical protein
VKMIKYCRFKKVFQHVCLLFYAWVEPFNGGEAGIRTLGGVAPTTVFETAPFDRSGTSP